jgi:D-aminoacyl-tRNA deacylase
MKTVIQRVKQACVSSENKLISKINRGLLVLIGFKQNDTHQNSEYIIKKITNLRIFSDKKNLMDKSIKDLNLEILLVSQFTLYADCKKGNRPSFSKAMPPQEAEIFYTEFVHKLKEVYPNIKTGIFGANMNVELINDGPVTIILEN